MITPSHKPLEDMGCEIKFIIFDSFADTDNKRCYKKSKAVRGEGVSARSTCGFNFLITLTNGKEIC